MLGIYTILRLAKNAFIGLVESQAQHVSTLNGVPVSAKWSRRLVSIDCSSVNEELTISFDGREGVEFHTQFGILLNRPDSASGLQIRRINNEVFRIPAPSKLQITKSILIILPKILWIIAKSSKDIFLFIRTKDPATSIRLQKRFGLASDENSTCHLPSDFFQERRVFEEKQSATIVVPIYNAANELENLLTRLNDCTHSILFVDDASNNPKIDSLLAAFLAQNRNSKLVKNTTNRGFVASANIGIEHAKEHVILLNSDTILPKGDWASRLLNPIFNDHNVSSVTPLSNNAEILSVPHITNHADPDQKIIDSIDYEASKISEIYEKVDLPTGIGFCMAMNRRFIDKIGSFDRAFGHGYGEEVDWCQKAIEAGGRNVGLASLFVGHNGGSSFGSEKGQRINVASREIAARYPDYEASVQNWTRESPAQAHLLALSIAWLAATAEDQVSVFIAHTMGGGAESALKSEIAKELETKSAVLILRVGGPSLWRIEFQGNGYTYRGDAGDIDTVLSFLAPLKRLNLIYSCGVGGRHPCDAAELILRLFDHRCTLEMRIHDYFPISPSWNLLDSKGRFNGVPTVDTKDLAHAVAALNSGPAVSHASWRRQWGKIVDMAQRITVFSESSAELFRQAYPSAPPKIVVRPHTLCDLPRAMRKGGSTVGVLGSLNRAKGAEVIQNLSLCRSQTRKLIVLGEMDGAFTLKRPHIFHGRYDQNRISDLGEKYDIGLWFIPSICPETFSFATHEALATGLPVVTFARGAQGEAVTAAVNGLPIDVDPNHTQEIAAFIERAFQTQKTIND